MEYENLFNYMRKEHGLILLQNEMQEIIRIIELETKCKHAIACNCCKTKEVITDGYCNVCGAKQA